MIGFCLFKLLPHAKRYVSKASIFHESLFLRCISNSPDHKESFAVSYLKNSLGFSQESAIKLTTSLTPLHFESPEKPDLTLKFFLDRGFSKIQVSSIIRRYPQLLLSNPDNTLLPKFEFFYSKGATVSGLAELILAQPNMLRRSLEKAIIPNYNFLKTLISFDEKVLLVLKRCQRIWDRDLELSMKPNIAILQEYGVPKTSIISLVIWQPRSLLTSCEKFRETVKEVKALGMDPLKMKFVVAVSAKRGMSKLNWEKKKGVYRECGWTDEEIMLAFTKYPHGMTYSREKITTTLDFFVKRMGWGSSMIARCPTVLSYSLEKRIIPRCLVFEALLAKGLIKHKFYFGTLLICTEKKFLQKYVTCYEENAPELLKLYSEKLNLAHVSKSEIKHVYNNC